MMEMKKFALNTFSGRLLLLFVLVLVMVFLTASAANPDRVEAPAQKAADKLESPTKPLSSFAEYELKPMVFSDEIEEGKSKRKKKAKEFEQSLNDRVSPLLESWDVASSEDGGDKLLIETKLINMRIVSKSTRFWTPTVVVGDSHIDLDLRLVNTTTGDEVANIEIRTSARKWGSGFTGVSDDTLDEYVVAIIYDYLFDNY